MLTISDPQEVATRHRMAHDAPPKDDSPLVCVSLRVGKEEVTLRLEEHLDRIFVLESRSKIRERVGEVDRTDEAMC